MRVISISVVLAVLTILPLVQSFPDLQSSPRFCYLIASGLTRSTGNPEGRAPLHVDEARRQEELVKYLEMDSADDSIRDHGG